MRKQTHPSHRRAFLFLGALTLFALEGMACFGGGNDEPLATGDPRLGHEKKVHFSSGCSSSMIMPVGAKETVSVTSAQENVALPADLAPQSSDPSVIAVAPGKDPFTIDFQALKKGQTDIEVTSAGARFDWVTFFVEPAKAVKFQSEPAVLAGGHLGLGVSEVYGACGTDECPLFGHSFIKWSTQPSGALTLLEDNLGLAHFTGGMAGTGDIVGAEPSEGAELLRHSVEVVDPATITGLSAQLTLIEAQEDSTPPKPVALPAKVSINAAFTIRLEGVRAGKSSVAISRHDIAWTATPMGLALVPQNEPADPVGEIFNALATGDYTLTAKVALLGGMEKSFVVTVVP